MDNNCVFRNGGVNGFAVAVGAPRTVETLVYPLAAPLPALAATPTAEKPYLGVRVEARANADSEQSGVTLGAVDPAGPAGEGGMKKGDHILSVGDTAVKTFDDLRNAITQHKPGKHQARQDSIERFSVAANALAELLSSDFSPPTLAIC